MDYLKDLRLDTLTNCYPKEYMEKILDRMTIEYNEDKKPFSVLAIDLDHFKQYNDKYGHLYGDELLKYFSGMLHRSFKDSGYIPIRFGGDEFVVIFPGAGVKESLALGNRFRTVLLNEPFVMQGKFFKVHYSGGIATYPRDSRNIKELLDKADKAMYHSKAHGRGRVTHYVLVQKLNAIRRVLFGVLALLVIAGVAVGMVLKDPKKYGMESQVKFLREKFSGIVQKPSDVFNPAANVPLDTVYMKSGRTFRGKVLSQNADVVKFGLGAGNSEGSVIIKKSDILRIEKVK